MGTKFKGDKDINYCQWCGKKTPMEKMQLPDTPILEHIEEKIDKYGRKKIWGDYADWSKLDLDSNFEAELLVYDEMLASISLKTVCEQCIKEDERLWGKYYGDSEYDDDDVIRFDADF